MSAIFGLVHWDGRPVAAGDLARMDAALAAHGPDGGDTWRDGSAGLGHRLSRVTPDGAPHCTDRGFTGVARNGGLWTAGANVTIPDSKGLP